MKNQIKSIKKKIDKINDLKMKLKVDQLTEQEKDQIRILLEDIQINLLHELYKIRGY